MKTIISFLFVCAFVICSPNTASAQDSIYFKNGRAPLCAEIIKQNENWVKYEDTTWAVHKARTSEIDHIVYGSNSSETYSYQSPYMQKMENMGGRIVATALVIGFFAFLFAR